TVQAQRSNESRSGDQQRKIEKEFKHKSPAYCTRWRKESDSLGSVAIPPLGPQGWCVFLRRDRRRQGYLAYLGGRHSRSRRHRRRKAGMRTEPEMRLVRNAPNATGSVRGVEKTCAHKPASQSRGQITRVLALDPAGDMSKMK